MKHFKLYSAIVDQLYLILLIMTKINLSNNYRKYRNKKCKILTLNSTNSIKYISFNNRFMI